MQCRISGVSRLARAGWLLVLAAGLCACSAKVVHPPLEVTFLPQRGDFVSGYGDRLSLEQVVELARGKDYILLGEGHRNACDHTVQQRVLAALAATDKAPAVGLEMVSVDMQPVLNDFSAGLVDVDSLEDELEWKTRWGYPYDYFRGFFEVIRRNSLPVAGLNVPTAVTRKIARQGMDSLTDDERAYLPAEIVPPSNAQAPFLDMMVSRHVDRGRPDGDEAEPDETTRRARFHLVQSIWDSKMAEEAVRLRRTYDWPVLLVAGSGHVENGWGIARRIRRFDPGAKILLIVPWRGGEFAADSGDALFYCPDSYVAKIGATLTDTGQGGLLVEAVVRGSRAEKAGLRPGDTLLEASGVTLDHLFALHQAGVMVHEADAPLVFTVRRAGQTFRADVGRLGSPKGSGRPKPAAAEPAVSDAADQPVAHPGNDQDEKHENVEPQAASDMEGGR